MPWPAPPSASRVSSRMPWPAPPSASRSVAQGRPTRFASAAWSSRRRAVVLVGLVDLDQEHDVDRIVVVVGRVVVFVGLVVDCLVEGLDLVLGCRSDGQGRAAVPQGTTVGGQRLEVFLEVLAVEELPGFGLGGIGDDV